MEKGLLGALRLGRREGGPGPGVCTCMRKCAWRGEGCRVTTPFPSLLLCEPDGGLGRHVGAPQTVLYSQVARLEVGACASCPPVAFRMTRASTSPFCWGSPREGGGWCSHRWKWPGASLSVGTPPPHCTPLRACVGQAQSWENGLRSPSSGPGGGASSCFLTRSEFPSSSECLFSSPVGGGPTLQWSCRLCECPGAAQKPASQPLWRPQGLSRVGGAGFCRWGGEAPPQGPPPASGGFWWRL